MGRPSPTRPVQADGARAPRAPLSVDPPADTVRDAGHAAAPAPDEGPADPEALARVQAQAAAELAEDDAAAAPPEAAPAGEDGPDEATPPEPEPVELADPNDVAVVARTALGLVGLALRRIEPRAEGVPPDAPPSVLRVALARLGAQLYERAPVIGAGLALQFQARLRGRTGWTVAAAVAGLFDPYAPPPPAPVRAAP